MKQQLYRLSAASKDRCAQGRLSTVVNAVGIGTMLEQHANGTRMIMVCREDEQGIPGAAGEVRRHTTCDAIHQIVGPPLARQIQRRHEELEFLLSEVCRHSPILGILWDANSDGRLEFYAAIGKAGVVDVVTDVVVDGGQGLDNSPAR